MEYDIWQEPMTKSTNISDDIQTIVVDAEIFNCLYSKNKLYEYNQVNPNYGYIAFDKIFYLIKSLRNECKGKIWNNLVMFDGTVLNYIIFKRETDNNFSVWIDNGSKQLDITDGLVNSINWKHNNMP